MLNELPRLQPEIARFYRYTNPDRYEIIARNHLIEQVRSHVRKWLPTYSVEVFGSERTGVAMPLSDIDFRLLSKSDVLDPAQAKFPPSVQERRVGIKTLQKLYKQGLCKDKAYLLPSLRQARYPLVTAQDRQSGLDIQIVLANDTSISRVIMQDYMEEIPYLRELYWVVKTIFDVRGLSDVFRGGFGSYSLFMMVVASIKHAPKSPKDSARALVHFLDFWGKFDTTKQGVSIEPAFFFDKAKHPVLTDTQRAKLEV
jgi:non-canonical poly(A) RNA polymerase PAPD5/7